MNMFMLAALVLATSSFAIGSQCPGVTNAMFDDATRAEIIAKHNEYRSQISHGTAKYMGGNTLKSGKNVYELSWDCGLEQSAQDWSDKCKSSASRPNNFGENFNLFAANGSVEVAMEAMEEWWAELEQYDASSNPDIIFNDDVFNYAESWSQMAWGEATKIGCGIKNCTLNNTEWSVITCHYDRGNQPLRPVFEVGNGCSVDADCTTYPVSTCNAKTKLCRKNEGGQTPAPQTTQPPKPATTLAPSECKDTARDCAIYAGYCFVQPYSRTVQRRCQKTCNVCNCKDTDPNCINQLNNCNLDQVRRSCALSCGSCERCADGAIDCAQMSHLCNDPTYGSIVRSRCKKTCNLC